MTVSCPHCDAANRDTAQFCAQCARPLRQTCGRCGASNPSRSRFCNKCGGPLSSSLRCSRCGRDNPEGSQFCNKCGAGLSTSGRQPPSPVQPAFGTTGHLAPQTKLANRYVIVERVGRGGMGAVYRAADERIPGKMWAIKEMSDAKITDLQDRQLVLSAFRREAMMLAALDHPNLPKVTDHFSEGGKQYLVMDFIEGETLEERIEREGGQPLEVDTVLGWAEQLCNVLEYLHGRSPPVVFRDLKPSNVMVTPEGTVKLIDFGIVRLFKPGKASDTAFFGTAGYSPKEQYGRGQTDGRSDIYALGATLYHLLTGDDPIDHPFDFEDLQGLNEEVPVAVADAVTTALADEPADRWQSVAEMRQALREASFSAPPPVSAQRQARPAAVPAAQPATVSPAPVAAVAQPVAAQSGSRLNLGRGAGLVVLGVLLVLAGRVMSRLADVPEVPMSLAFVVPLFSILFGPWVGGVSGLFGYALVLMLWSRSEEMVLTPVGAVAGLVMGIVPAWLIRNPKNWIAVIGAGIVASVLWALAFATGVGVVFDAWFDFLQIAIDGLLLVLPANVVFLPFFAHGLVRGNAKWYGVLGTGVAVSAIWVVLAGVSGAIRYRHLPWMWEIGLGEVTLYTLLVVLPVSLVLIPLLALWLAGSVRRGRLYWRG